MRRSSGAIGVAGLLLALGALTWPAAYNGQPFFFPDTTAYIRGADAGIEKVTHVSTPWSQPEEPAVATTPLASPSEVLPTPSVSSIKDKTVLYGRSVYYGALLYVGDRLGGFWFTVIVQAILLLTAMALVLRALAVPLWPQLVIISVLMGLATSAPFYASFLMPDMFAAVTILACATLIAVREPLPRADLIVWVVLLALSLVFHSSHVLIAAVMLAAALAWNLVRRSWANWRGLAVIATCLAGAAAAEALFGVAVEHFVGAPPLRPPFLMARLIEDGPGYRYLRKTCPDSGFEACKFVDRLPMSANQFLWGFTPSGVFATSSGEIRRALAAEQFRFTLAVLRDQPLETLAATGFDALRQIGMVGLAEFDWSDNSHVSFVAKLPPAYRDRFRASAAYRGLVPTRLAAALEAGMLILSIATLLALLLVPALRARLDSVQARLTTFVLVGLLANGIVCGALAGPHDRYQARAAWILPFLALALAPVVTQRIGARKWWSATPFGARSRSTP